jgi:A repeated domain in UCH-protein
MQDIRQDIPSDLQNVVMDERSRFRYTHLDLENAIKFLGFGNDGPLSIEFDEEVSEEFITNAWKDKVRRAWRDPRDGAEIQRDANESFRIVAEARGSVALRKLWEDNQGRTMNPDRAYSTLEIPAEVDDDMVLTVFSLRVCFTLSHFHRFRSITRFIRSRSNRASAIKCERRCLLLLSLGTVHGCVGFLRRAQTVSGLFLSS